MRYNGTFQYRNHQDPAVDEETGFSVGTSENAEPWEPGERCQIDVSTVTQLSGEDGRVYKTLYTVFVPRPFHGTLDIGTKVHITMEDGSENTFTVERIDNQNRMYIEIGN